jgi:dihydropteroate synthase
MHARTVYRMEWGRHRLELGRRTCVMGIVNVTPDSFSDGGRFLDRRDAVAQGVQMASAGADIVDVGGESTRPFSQPVSADEEIRRVVPVVAELASRIRIPISIDTSKAAVARPALEAGAAMINDISALRSDPGLAALAAEFGVPVILMHMRGEPRTMQVAPRYDELVGEIYDFLQQAADAAVRNGILRERLIVDPGIGFGKTPEHNLQLMRRLSEFVGLDLPLLVGPSRKSFIRRLVKPEGEKDISPDLPVVETGTQAAVATSIFNGAHIVRVHDVANTLATVKVVDAILNS